MPFVPAGDLRVHYALSGPSDAPLVILSHSLGASLAMWGAQAAALERRFRVLRYDTRGHGQTAVTPGPYTLPQLAGDVVNLLDALGQGRVHFCGLSLGGQIGMWLGAHAAPRIDRLVLCNTGARIGTATTWNARIDTVRLQGMAGVAPSIIERWFTPAFRARSPETVARTRAMLDDTPPEGYAAACAALRDADERADLPRITRPTLVITGRHDPATPPAEGRAIAAAVAGAEYRELEASHLSNLEDPERFTDEVLRFLTA